MWSAGRHALVALCGSGNMVYWVTTEVFCCCSLVFFYWSSTAVDCFSTVRTWIRKKVGCSYPQTVRFRMLVWHFFFSKSKNLKLEIILVIEKQYFLFLSVSSHPLLSVIFYSILWYQTFITVWDCFPPSCTSCVQVYTKFAELNHSLQGILLTPCVQ